MTVTRIITCGLVLQLSAACATLSEKEDAVIVLEMASRENALDGCTQCGCKLSPMLVGEGAIRSWFTFGLVGSNQEPGWKVQGSPSYCGLGAFDDVAPDFSATVGSPYVIAELIIDAALRQDSEIGIEVDASIRRLSDFESQGVASYGQTKQTGSFRVSHGDDLVLPLFLPEDRAGEQFGVNEVLFLLKATAVATDSIPAYGSIQVNSDVAGVEIFLDEGYVGRVAEDGPSILNSVPAGTHSLLVRDYSGRESRQRVTVRESNATEVRFELLGNRNQGSDGLVPLGLNEQGQDEFWRSVDGAYVIWIPAGEFLMGSPPGEGESNETPQHVVYVTDYLIDKTEVTWRQYERYLKAAGKRVSDEPAWGTPGSYPVSFVTWDEARDYCEWAGGRLPTEAEWEKAARGTDGSKYPWGDHWDAARCNSISGGAHRPASAGSYRQCISVYGVLDLSGSMWEWTADWYDEDYYAVQPERDPQGPESGTAKTVRGGGWMSQPAWLRPAHRYRQQPSARKPDHGFRCAMHVPAL